MAAALRYARSCLREVNHHSERLQLYNEKIGCLGDYGRILAHTEWSYDGTSTFPGVQSNEDTLLGVVDGIPHRVLYNTCSNLAVSVYLFWETIR